MNITLCPRYSPPKIIHLTPYIISCLSYKITLRILCSMSSRLYILPPDPSSYKITLSIPWSVSSRLYTLPPPDPFPYKITTHPSGYHAQCHPGLHQIPRLHDERHSLTIVLRLRNFQEH